MPEILHYSTMNCLTTLVYTQVFARSPCRLTLDVYITGMKNPPRRRDSIWSSSIRERLGLLVVCKFNLMTARPSRNTLHSIPADNIQPCRANITSHDCEGRKACPKASQRYSLTRWETPDLHAVGHNIIVTFSGRHHQMEFAGTRYTSPRLPWFKGDLAPVRFSGICRIAGKE
jgi:hypothetical protein